MESLSNRLFYGAALVSIVGVAGMYIYEHINSKRREAMIMKNVTNLEERMAVFSSSLAELKKQQLAKSQLPRVKVKKRVRREPAKISPSGDAVDGADKNYASDSEYFTDYQSIVGTESEMDSEEFYDVPTDDETDDTLTESIVSGPINPLDEDPDCNTNSPKKAPSST